MKSEKNSFWASLSTYHTAILLILMLGQGYNLWLQGQYVSQTRFEQHVKSDEVAHTEINKTLKDISITLAVMAKQDAMLQDHETRIRRLELNKVP